MASVAGVLLSVFYRNGAETKSKVGAPSADPPHNNIAATIGYIGSAALIGGSIAYALYSPPKTTQQVMTRLAFPQFAGLAGLVASYLHSEEI